jgi:hypothetical protein
MSKHKFLSFITVFCAVFTFISCDNEPIDSALNLDDFDNGGNGGNGNGPALFQAKFSDAVWTATNAEAVISGNLIALGGERPNGEGFGFLIQGTALGTYPANTNLLTYTPADSEYGYWSTNINDPAEDTGSITITNINTTNKTISGTFSYKGYWSDSTVTNILPIVFTEGKFENIPYVTQAETNDTFFAKVDGAEFVDVDLLSTIIGINGQDYISVAGQDSNLDAITVSVRSNLAIGTYPLTGNVNNDLVQCIYDFDDVSYNAISGSVTIISKTPDRIRGTFSCMVSDGTDDFIISEGAFDVAY